MAGKSTSSGDRMPLWHADRHQAGTWTGTALRRRVLLTYGPFDGLAGAQTRLLRHLSTLCDELIVGCSSDLLLAERGVIPRLPFATRFALLEKCRFVDRVIIETSEHQKRTDIVNYNAAVFAVSQDRSPDLDDLEDIAQVLYLPAEQRFPSSFEGHLAGAVA